MQSNVLHLITYLVNQEPLLPYIRERGSTTAGRWQLRLHTLQVHRPPVRIAHAESVRVVPVHCVIGLRTKLTRLILLRTNIVGPIYIIKYNKSQIPLVHKHELYADTRLI